MNANRNESISAMPRSDRWASSAASDRLAPLASAAQLSTTTSTTQSSFGNYPPPPPFSSPDQKIQGKGAPAHPSQKECSSSHLDEKHEHKKKEITPASQQPEDLPISVFDIVPIPATKPEKKVLQPQLKKENSARSKVIQENVCENDEKSCFSESLNDFHGPPSTYRISHETCFTKYAEDHLLHLLDGNEHEGRIPIPCNNTETYRLSCEVGHLSFASSLSIDIEENDSTTDDEISSLGDDDESSLAEGEIFRVSLNDDHQGSLLQDHQESSNSNRYCVSYERGHLSLGDDLGLDDDDDEDGGVDENI